MVTVKGKVSVETKGISTQAFRENPAQACGVNTNRKANGTVLC